ncbi:MAG: ABC transporter permease [Planctomycetota bacterium]
MSWFRAFSTMFRRTWSKVFRRPAILLLSFLQPLIWMSFFGFLFQRYPLSEMRAGIGYIDFLVPGICAMTVLVGASQSGIGLIRDMHSGFLDRLLHSPANNLAMLAGKLSADILRLVIQALIVAVIGLAIGARFQLEFFGLVYGLTCLVVFASGYSLLSCCFALLTKRQETMASFVHLVNMPIFFTSTALVPARQMPNWLQTIAAWNPLTLVVEPLRSSMIYGDAKVIPSSLSILVVCSVLLSILTFNQWNNYLKSQVVL